MIENLFGAASQGGAAGVTGFTPSQNTAAPNNTVNASRLLVDAASTNADAVIQPKGTGAIVAQLPDGAAAGGNKRGPNAVDLQTNRTVATSVASGTESVVIGGHRNTASNTNSTALGGLVNTASGVCSVTVGGASNTASGDASFATGRSAIASGVSSFAGGGGSGSGSTASGDHSFAFGQRNTASGTHALAFGADCEAASSFAIGVAAKSTQARQLAHASGQFSVVGDAQYERYVVYRVTTNATPAELAAAGTPATTTRIAIANDSTYAFEALVVARRTDADNESAGYKITGVIDNNAGTTALVGTPTVTVLAEDTAAWDIAVTADNTNDALVFTVTGENAKTIRWVATVHLTKVTG